MRNEESPVFLHPSLKDFDIGLQNKDKLAYYLLETSLLGWVSVTSLYTGLQQFLESKGAHTLAKTLLKRDEFEAF